MKIIIAGDFVLQKRALAVDNYLKMIELVRDINASADYSLINLEAPIVLGNTNPIKKTGPNLKSSVETIDIIKKMKFTGVTLANNHFYDYGEVGVNDTIQMCKQCGLDYMGGGKNLKEACEIFYKSINGIKIAFVNFCENEWSIATEVSGGSAPLDLISNYYQILEAKSKSDYVIVIVHGGTELYNLPTPRMKKTYRFFIDIGADIVVNHHQHCFSGYELYKEKYIFYGIGNFCFDRGPEITSYWNIGYMIKLIIEDKMNFEIIPYIQYAETPSINFKLDIKKFTDEIERLNLIIADEQKLNEAFEEMCKSKTNSMLLALEPYHNKYLKYLRYRKLLPSLISPKCYQLIFALFRCEAHRDIMFNILNNKIRQC